MEVIVSGTRGGTLTLTASSEANCAPRVVKSADVKILTVAALLLEAVDEADPVRVGDNVIYDIRVTNQGSGPDSNIRVSATLPDEEQFVNATGVTEATVTGRSIRFAPIARLAPKETVTWKVAAKALRAGDVTVPGYRHQRRRARIGTKDGADETVLVG